MDLHPDFPIVSGHYQLTSEWSAVLPIELNRRVEDGSLVLWRKGFTSWFEIWNNDKNESKEARLARLKSEISPNASDIKEVSAEKTLKLSYRLSESAEDNRLPALYCFALGKNGHVQAAFYFDKPEGIALAQKICGSLSEEAI